MDIHLDTSWCPVCEKAILPKRYIVPIPSPTPEPVPQQPAAQPARTSQTSSRGKGNKSRFVGGGLLHGTGRIRPGGGLRRDSSSTNVNSKDRSPQKQNAAALATAAAAAAASASELQQRQNSLPLRQRTVIDQSQTPLYCSDECRKRDELTFGDSLAPVRNDSSQRLRHGVDIAPHPFDLNPARHSPPPPPPVPPNSLRVSATVSEAEQSDSSSSGSGESFGTSSFSGGKPSPNELIPRALSALRESERRADNSVPVPPEVPPMPLHPHRPSAPARKPGEGRAAGGSQPLSYDGGIMMAAKRLQEMIFPAAEVKEEKVFDWKNAPRGVLGRGGDEKVEKSRAEEEEEEKRKVEKSYEWKKLVYGAPPSSSTTTTRGVASTHRRASAPSTSEVPTTTTTYTVPQISAQSRAQSALELYAKYPLFSKAKSHGSNQSLSALPTTSTSFSHSYASEFAKSRSTSTEDVNSNSERRRRQRREERRQSQSQSSQDPLYEGKKLSTKQYEPRPILPSGAEGKLIVPNVMLPPLSSRPSFASTRSSSRLGLGSPLGGVPPRVSSAPVLRRHDSDVSTRSALNSVAEEGHSRDHHGDSKSDGRAESRERERQERRERKERKAKSSGLRKERTASCESSGSGGSGSGSQSGSPTRSVVAAASTVGMTAPERRRFNMEHRTWSYENLDGPKYDTMPPVPVVQRRLEEVFIADAEDPSNPSNPSNPDASAAAPALPKEELIIHPFHVHDVEISRVETKAEVSRRRGVHEGRSGWFVEKEWAVTAIPERKRLFLFAGKA